MAEVRPAHFATSDWGTPTLSIISGRYGRYEVTAMGSAKRHIERMRSCRTGSLGVLACIKEQAGDREASRYVGAAKDLQTKKLYGGKTERDKNKRVKMGR
jgi:hypothetical protein